jgi:glycosyltransferase involved in cell wall biosynthesis
MGKVVKNSRTLRSLFVATMTYPPIGGEFLRNWQNINILQQFGPVGIFSIFDRPLQVSDQEGVQFWQHFNTRERVSLRSHLERGTQWLRQWGLTYYCTYLSSIAHALDQCLTEFQPDLVIVEQLWLYPYLSVIKQHPCRIVFDAHNVEAPLYQATRCLGPGVRSQVRTRLHIPQIQANERSLVHHASQVWVCSEHDQQQLQQLYGEPSSYVVPNGIDLGFYDNIYGQRLENAGNSEHVDCSILFLANFAHIPNAQAAQILITEIYPQLKSNVPACRLLLVGRHPTPFMLNAANQDPAICVTGELPDVRPYLALASLMVVPLQAGSGTRLKILEAFAAGCPVVSTAKGVEGLTVQDGEHLLIRDTVSEMVCSIRQLWADASLQARLTDSAYKLVKVHYAWDAVAKHVEAALKSLF